MRSVLITGGAGFIGSHLARACLARGDRVTIVVRPSSSLHRLSGIVDKLQLEKLNTTDADALRDVLNRVRPDVVFHMAAATRLPQREHLADIAYGIEHCMNPLVALLTAASGCIRPPSVLVRAGSIAEYGAIPAPFKETDREQPTDSYGVSLLSGTKFLTMAMPRLPFAAVTARLALTYGPHQSPDFLVSDVVTALVRGHSIELRRPEDSRDLIFVEDAVDALISLSEDPEAAGPVVNVSTGRLYKTAEVAGLIAKYASAAPDLVKFGSHNTPPVGLCCDRSLITSKLGWVPAMSLPSGLQKTVEWARQSMLCET